MRANSTNVILTPFLILSRSTFSKAIGSPKYDEETSLLSSLISIKNLSTNPRCRMTFPEIKMLFDPAGKQLLDPEVKATYDR